MRIAEELTDLFVRVGLPVPSPVPVMRAKHQIAQKIHALSEPGSERVGDLVDLQLLEQNESLDFDSVADICRRLFAYRTAHALPPLLKVGSNWGALYNSASENVNIRPDVESAVEWFNDFVQKINGHAQK